MNEDELFALVMIACVLLFVDALADVIEGWQRRRSRVRLELADRELAQRRDGA